MESVVKKYSLTGECEIIIEKVIKQWSHLWAILDCSDKYRLIKYKRKDSQITALKAAIPNGQAKELIKTLGLIGTKNPVFRRYTSYRKPEHTKPI